MTSPDQRPDHDRLLDLPLSSGRLRARSLGPEGAPLTLLVHGLSAHLHAFDLLAERLASPSRRLVALDLRGRGRSERTPAGSYGLRAHARDVLEAATLLGAERFDLVGWSMGAAIAMVTAHAAPARVGKVVLLDHAGGGMDPGAVQSITKGLARLDRIVPRPEVYLAAIRAAGSIAAWSPFWDQYYTYELAPLPEGEGAGFRPSTDRRACLEDLADVPGHDWPALGEGLRCPALLVRCLRPINGGFIVTVDARDALARRAANLRVFEDDSDHYSLMTSETAHAAVERFLE